MNVSFITDSLAGLVNKITGTGTSRDKLMASTWMFTQPDDQQLNAMYRSAWIAAKLIDIPIDDMLREGWTWQAEGDQITDLEAEEKRLGIAEKLNRALTRDSIYGGAAFVLGIGNDDPSEPLVLENVRKGDLKYVIVTGRGELEVLEFQIDPAEDFGEPLMFQMLAVQGPPIHIHPSRVIPFIGRPVHAPMSMKGDREYWGDSRMASVTRDIAAALSGVSGVGRMMDELAITYHKMGGLTEMLATTNGEDLVKKVLQLSQTTKSAINSVAIDAEDDVEVITANFAGIPEAVRSLMQNVSGAADIPLTRFLGSSPDGMNATGASDIRNYYDRLAGRRAHYVEPSMKRFDEILIRSTFGSYDDTIWRVWNPLWQLSETEQVEVDAKKMTMMKDLAMSGIVHDHAVEQVTRNMMIDSPTFQGAEAAFEEADAMPEPDPVDVEAANSIQTGAGQPPTVATPPLVAVGGTDLGDMEPKPLYVSRDLLNGEELVRWAKEQGFKETLTADDMHVTIAYSRTPLDWMQVGEAWDEKLEISAGGPRHISRFGDATVLEFASNSLRYRHESIMEAGASWDHPEYRCHVTISYDPEAPTEISPYRGKLVFGPEIFKAIDENWQASVSREDD